MPSTTGDDHSLRVDGEAVSRSATGPIQEPAAYTHRAAPAGHDAIHPAVGVDVCAGGHGLGQVAEIHAELRRVGAAEVASAAPLAPVGVSPHRLDHEPSLFGADPEEPRPAALHRGGYLLHVGGLFDVVEVALHRLRVVIGEGEVLRPLVEDVLGDAKTDAPGEHRRSAHAAADLHGDRRRAAQPDRHGHGSVAPDVADRFAGSPGAVLLRRHPRALLEDHHRQARLGQLAGDDRAAGSGADDDDVTGDVEGAAVVAHAVVAAGRHQSSLSRSSSSSGACSPVRHVPS